MAEGHENLSCFVEETEMTEMTEGSEVTEVTESDEREIEQRETEMTEGSEVTEVTESDEREIEQRELEWREIEEDAAGLSHFLRVLMLIIGVHDRVNRRRYLLSNHGGYLEKCRRYVWILILIILLVFNAVSLLALWLYALCYLTKYDHYLRLLSHLCYRPPMMAVQAIALVAMVKNAYEHPNDRSWVNSFSEVLVSAKLNRYMEGLGIRSKWWIGIVFVAFILVPVAHVALKLGYFFVLWKECRYWIEDIWIVSEAYGSCFFALFWFFIYLQRKSLEWSMAGSLKYIKENSEQCDKCFEEIRRFFRQYYPLRCFTMPWMYVYLFTSTFGLAIVFNWNHNKDSELATATFASEVEFTNLTDTDTLSERICIYSCDTREFLQGHKAYLLYNTWILWRHIMTLILPYVSLLAIDIEHIWKDFRTDMWLLYTEENDKKWRRIYRYAEKLHPTSSMDILLTFILPVIALVSGILSREPSNL